MLKNKSLVSIPYIYPLCPLNFNHAKMFIVADILSRYLATSGNNVIFSVASHYSGNTAQSTSEILERVFSKKNKKEDLKTFKLHRDFYHTPISIMKSFKNSKKLLDYYTQEIYWELKSLNLSANFEYSYSTNHKDFSIFVTAIINAYDKNKLLIKNNLGNLALNYDDPLWKSKVKKQINKTEFIQSFHKKNILAAMNNIRNDWGFLRTTGFGVKYKNKWIIDPMFDSELFTIFDLYIRFKDVIENEIKDTQKFFNKLFIYLESGKKSKNKLINKILSNLPCDYFVGEEHLKNWVVKKFYSESALLHPKYQTKAYLLLGMSLLDGKTMSASKGHAILSKDLLNKYGPDITRLTLILSGGNVSKTCNFNRNLPETASSFIKKFQTYLIQLVSLSKNNEKKITQKLINELNNHSDKIDSFLESGYYRQAVIEIISIAPNKYHNNNDQSNELLNFYKKYLEIILPGFINKFI